MIYSPPVKWSWVGAINGAQKDLMKRKDNIKVPILIMTSSRKIAGCNYTPEFLTGDAVLDPSMIRERGEQFSNNTVCVIDSGIHDLILSPLPARKEARDEIFRYIRTHQQ